MGARLRIGLVTCGAVVVVACQGVGSGPNEDDPQVTADVATVVAEVTFEDHDIMAQHVSDATGPDFALRMGCGRFGFGWWCGARGFHLGFGHGNLSIEREVTFRDGDGNVQETFDDETTESIQFVFSLVGEWSHGRVTVSVDQQRDFTVSGLAGVETQHTWNGTATSTKNRTRVVDDEGERTYDVSMSTVVEDVVVPVPRSWPLSGRITRDVTVTKSDGTVRQRTVTVTFNGTPLVPLMVNGTEFTLDLEHRRIVEEEG